ncbi:ATP-binding cassette domain-containing protein [Microbacterium sp. G2-8]|uniref:ATP-binding cassette domain-containing protein n=1 Tax=Microbacterium sp. G2-8 TaxID=2842454 RepID=UPI0027E3ABA3|nr:ATP-binding cassette domain-containing protein [Microbacterium sp. G2-8]
MSVTHVGASRPAIRDVSFSIGHGEVVLLAGPSGAGKSTLAQTLNGIVPHAIDAEVAGDVVVLGESVAASSPAHLSTRVAMVFQDPDAQVVTGSVYDEVAFALENLLLDVSEIADRVERALRVVELWERRRDDPDTLSGGGRQRLAIACALAMESPLIVLDEPTANLDPAGVRDVASALREIAAAGDRSLLLIEHDLDVALPLATRLLVLDHDGALAFDGAPDDVMRDHGQALHDLGVHPVESGDAPGRDDDAAEPVVTVCGLTIARSGREVLHVVAAEVPRGSFTAVTGPNGAGKTTLAQAMAGVIRAPRGSVTVAGADPWRTRRRTERIGFVFQNPEHQFVAHTVRAELAHSAGGDDERVTAMLDRLGLAEHAEDHPFRLSGGQKRRLSVGTALIAMRPGGVLVLDEPLYGQDGARADALVEMLEELRREGTTIVVVTHDRRLVAQHATHVIELSAGPPAPVAPASARTRPLEVRDPLAKLAAVVPAMIGLVFTRDMLTPAIFLVIAYAALLVGTRFTRRVAMWLLIALPAIVGILALGFGLWSTPAVGLATGLRLAALLALALIPGLTSEGVDIVRALVAHARVPYRIGYAAFAALRFVPRFRHELRVIRAAHRVRGIGGRGPWAASRTLVPLLAGAIRHAERVALAMDARAFGAFPTRTERHAVQWHAADTVLVIGGIVMTAAVFTAGILL